MTDPQAWRSHHAKMRGEDIEVAARYFASAGSLWDADQSPSLAMMPYSNGKVMRHFWKRARASVRLLVLPRAYALLEAEFGRGKPGRQFEYWGAPERRELYALCKPTGCLFWIDEHGNVLPHGIRSMETYCEDLRALTNESDE